MTTLTSDSQEIGADEFPFYSNEIEAPVLTKQKPQDRNSDTVAGFKAVTADKAGPNKLVATGLDGKLPTSIIPTTGSFVIYSRDGLTTYTLIVESDGALSVNPV